MSATSTRLNRPPLFRSRTSSRRMVDADGPRPRAHERRRFPNRECRTLIGGIPGLRVDVAARSPSGSVSGMDRALRHDLRSNIRRLMEPSPETPRGAHANAALYSLMETARATGVEPVATCRTFSSAYLGPRTMNGPCGKSFPPTSRRGHSYSLKACQAVNAKK